jgi:hypothetical protein
MDGERIGRAIDRIEAAARRIGAAASRPSQSVNSQGDPELQSKYEALRSEAGSALAELDRLLVALDQ